MFRGTQKKSNMTTNFPKEIAKTSRQGKFYTINEILYKWYKKYESKNVFLKKKKLAATSNNSDTILN